MLLRKLNNTKSIFLFSILYSFSSVGQTFQTPADELYHFRKEYPDEDGVILMNKEVAKISVVNNNLLVETTTNQENIYLTEEAKYFGKEKLYFNSFTGIKNIDAYSLVPGTRKYSKEKVKGIETIDSYSRGVFHSDSKAHIFYYPDVDKGTKTYLSYERKYNEPVFYGKFYFGEYMPTVKSEYEVIAPSEIKINYKIFGVKEDRIKFTETTEKGITTYKWSIENIPALKPEEESINVSNYIPHIIVYVNSYPTSDGEKPLIRDVADLYAWYWSLVKDNPIEDNSELRALVDSLTNGIEDEKEKVKSIYYWVQDNVKYIAFEDGLGGFIPRQADLVCERRFGDCKDMANITYNMLKLANIDAHLTWIGTRDIPYSYYEVPTPSTDNHMICTYNDGKKWYFLDATGKNRSIEIPTAFIQGKEALVGEGEKFEIVKVPEVPAETNLFYDSSVIQLKKDVVLGKAEAILNGYPKSSFTDVLLNQTEKENNEFLSSILNKGNNKFTLEDESYENLKEKDKPLYINYDYKVENYYLTNDDEIYFNPFLKKSLKKEKIETEETKLAKEKRYKTLNEQVYLIEIPEGYYVKKMPSNSSFSNDKFGYTIKFEKDKNFVKLKMSIKLDYLVMEPEEFEKWNEMIQALRKEYQNIIIFKKDKQL